MPERRRPAHSAPARAPAVVSPARAAAFAILLEVGTSAAHSDDLLHGPALAPLSQPDRDLATALVMGVLRWQIALDARLAPLLSRPDLSVAEPVAIALRLGALQLGYMDRIPPHAALNESVELVRVAGHPHAAGMVNAVLRKLLTLPAPRRPLVESTPAMAERLGHPRWLAERWAAQYGRAAAEAICGFDQAEPECAPLFGSPEGSPQLPMPVMDAGSRLVAELAAAVRPGAQRVWDCCAAPGGKTLVLARRLPGASLLATDTSDRRLRRLGDRLEREGVGEQVRLARADAAALPVSFGVFDLILCDVPCSGTGTLARNPEIRHRLNASELGRQAERQRRILTGALQRLAPGGVLVYSTCSLEREECEAVVEAVCAEQDAAITAEPVGPVLAALTQGTVLQAAPDEAERWLRGPMLRTLPGANFPGDGFFAALLTRAATDAEPL